MKNQFHTPFSNSRPRLKLDCQAAKEDEAKKIADPNGRQNQGAKQSFADECDINVIIARGQRAGQIGQAPQLGPENFPDLAGPQSFLEALEIVEKAEQTFLGLPAAVRAECFNRPDIFLERVQDTSWAAKHGLLATLSPASPEPAQPPAGAPGAPRTGSLAAPSPAQPGPSESTKG